MFQLMHGGQLGRYGSCVHMITKTGRPSFLCEMPTHLLFTSLIYSLTTYVPTLCQLLQKSVHQLLIPPLSRRTYEGYCVILCPSFVHITGKTAVAFVCWGFKYIVNSKSKGICRMRENICKACKKLWIPHFSEVYMYSLISGGMGLLNLLEF